MKIIVKATKFKLTPALLEYIEKKFSSLDKLIKNFDKDNSLVLRVEIAITTKHHHKGDLYYVECTMPINKKILRIEQLDQDMHAAIDDAQKRFKLEIERFKEKVSDKVRKIKKIE